MGIVLNNRDYEYKVLKYLNKDAYRRTYKSINSIELVDDDYYRVEVNYTEHFIKGDFDDVGIYFIDKDELDFI